jgi:hypothetical protein
MDVNTMKDTNSLPWVLRTPARFALLRLAVYGTVGLASELFFYNLVRWCRRTSLLAWAFRFDWRVDPRLHLDAVWQAPQEALYGQASLWMFLVYGVCSLLLIEPLFRRTRHLPWVVRGTAYALAILVYEWASGWALKWATGYAIWYYADPAALGTMTSWALVPSWMVTGLIAEGLYRGMRLLAPLVQQARAVRGGEGDLGWAAARG